MDDLLEFEKNIAIKVMSIINSQEAIDEMLVDSLKEINIPYTFERKEILRSLIISFICVLVKNKKLYLNKI